MSYFEALSDALFKEDPQGNTVFYPWGVMGKGVILDSQERREAIAAFLLHFYSVGFVLIALTQLGIFVMHIELLITTLWLLISSLLMLKWYTYRLDILTMGLIKEPHQSIQPQGASATSAQPIEWSTKNIALIAVVSSIMIGIVAYVVTDAQKEFDERMERYQAMSTEEMARYLATLNAEPERIDPITLHAGTEHNGSTIYFYRELSDNFLSHIDEPAKEQANMSKQLKWEMCGLPTYDLFYQKGGRLVYVYHHVVGEQKRFMFEIPIDATTCS